MVLTDMPFNRPDAFGTRYAVLRESGDGITTVQEAEEQKQAKSQEYAAFLKEKERQCGPDGFLDSRRFQHTFAVKRETSKEIITLNRPQPTTVVDIHIKKERNERDFQRCLKIIEDHMWQHKQEERELKRAEGDIVKNQRAVRRTIREFENTMARKRLEETKKLNQGLDKYTQEQNTYTHKREELTKQRIEANLSADQSLKDMGRKVTLTTSHLARKFRAKASEIDLKKSEVERLNREYEGRIKAKEDDQFRLKKELAKIAISINLEAQKGKQMESDLKKDQKRKNVNRIKDDRATEVKLENKLGKSDGDIKAAEVNRRKLSADLTFTRGHLQVKQREETRHRQDTEARLRSNMTEQKALNDAAMHADMDAKARHAEQKMSDHEARRRALALLTHRQKKDKTEAQESHFADKFKLRHTDLQRREHEDQLKFFQKIVTKSEETEHNLYNRVRNAEYARQKQEQSVKRMQSQLHKMKRENSKKIKTEVMDLDRNEKSLEQKLIREQAGLAKVQAEREETYISLQKHREMSREEHHLMHEHQREHTRLTQVAVKNDNLNG